MNLAESYLYLLVSHCLLAINLSQSNPPVVKYLASEDVSTNTPTYLMSLLYEPIMTQCLCIKVMNLKRRMVNMRLGSFIKEEAVVINHFLTAIEVKEGRNISSCLIVYEL